ncbi:WD repeat-containing protein 86 isoform X3 [Halichoerus grypus]|uniref:WD repeat-containing protein 86 isoform X3 n=1 Tax=Halichoerus grypus TaxID=9711 RepID=UPI00165903F8|nr:WD repeat-containing protein 86 isoform X3 [Halichoerus grypus]
MPGRTGQASGPQNFPRGATCCHVVTFPYTFACPEDGTDGVLGKKILVANNQLFSSSYDRTARAWSVDEGQVSQEFRGHRNCVLTLAYSAPWDLPGAPCAEEVGGLLVTGSTDGTAKVWQVTSGCCHQTLRGHTGAVLCLVLDTPSHTAFTGSTDTTIRAWDILSGEQLRVFREHQGSVICLELVNRHVYSGSADRTVKCWLADTGERVRTFAAHRHSVSALKYHAGTLFTGSGDARARAFDARSGALQRVFRGHAFVINCIQVHEQVLYTASHDGALRLWDVRGLPCAPPPPRPAAPARSRSRLFSNKGLPPHSPQSLRSPEAKPVLKGNGISSKSRPAAVVISLANCLEDTSEEPKYTSFQVLWNMSFVLHTLSFLSEGGGVPGTGGLTHPAWACPSPGGW